MKNTAPLPKTIFSDRLLLFPFTMEICADILNENYHILERMGLQKGRNWPDSEFSDTLPRIIANLSKVNSPTGFESWMIIKKETDEIIGDIGFKGFDHLNNSCDIGYGIIEAERGRGYAEESAKCLINWVLTVDPSVNITAATLKENSSSIKLLQKLNFIETKRDANFIYWKL